MASNRFDFNVYDRPVSIQPSKQEQYPNAPVFSAYQLTGLYDLPHAPIILDDDLEFADEIFRGQHLKSLRFLLTKQGEMRFGREGKPVARKTPSHALLPRTPRENCLSPGNIFVDPQNQICKITNKSSNYKEDGHALQFAIAAFYILSIHHAGIQLAPTIMLEIIKAEHCGGIQTFTYTRDEFINLATKFISHYRSLPSFYSDNAFLFDYTAEKIALWRELDIEEKEDFDFNERQRVEALPPLFLGNCLRNIFDDLPSERTSDTDEHDLSLNKNQNVETLTPLFLVNALNSPVDEVSSESTLDIEEKDGLSLNKKQRIEEPMPSFSSNGLNSLFDNLLPEHDKENIPLRDMVPNRKKPRSLYNNFSGALFTSTPKWASSNEETSLETTQRLNQLIKRLNNAV